MGFFSFVGKALGKVAKAGLSVVTHGVSDKVLSVAKGLGTQKATSTRAQGGLTTLKDQTAVMKVTQGTKKNIPASTASAVAKKATAIDYQAKVIKSTTRRKASKPLKKAKLPAAVAKTKGKRTPPKGGLDLKAMSTAWKAAGKPGTWQGWIKSNPLKS